MTRARRPPGGRSEGLRRDRARQPSAAPAPPPTPLPAEELLRDVRELRDLLAELVGLTGCGDAWALRVLRRNVALALLTPATLERPENQLDFIEELAEAVWDGADASLRHTACLPSRPEQAAAREARRRAAVERFDTIAHRLCGAAMHWTDRLAAAAAANPQP